MNAPVNVIYWLSEVPSTSIRNFFFSFFLSFSFSFCPPVTRPEKKNNHRNTLVSLLAWKDRIGIFYEHDHVTAYNLKRNKNVSLPFCIFKIVTYLKFSISGWLFKLIIKSKPDLISRASLPPIIKWRRLTKVHNWISWPRTKISYISWLRT